MEFISKFNIF